MLCTFHPRFMLRVESNSVNLSKWCLIDPIWSKWLMSLDLLMHAICAYIFKGERVNVYIWVPVVHVVMCEAAESELEASVGERLIAVSFWPSVWQTASIASAFFPMLHGLWSSRNDGWGRHLIQAGTVLTLLFSHVVVLMSAIMHAMLERRWVQVIYRWLCT